MRRMLYAALVAACALAGCGMPAAAPAAASAAPGLASIARIDAEAGAVVYACDRELSHRSPERWNHTR